MPLWLICRESYRTSYVQWAILVQWRAITSTQEGILSTTGGPQNRRGLSQVQWRRYFEYNKRNLEHLMTTVEYMEAATTTVDEIDLENY